MSNFRAITIYILSCQITAFVLSEYIAPANVYNIAHVSFPSQQMLLQNFKSQIDIHGIPKGIICSSYIGPYCISSELISSESAQNYLSDISNDEILTFSEEDELRFIIKKIKTNDYPKDIIKQNEMIIFAVTRDKNGEIKFENNKEELENMLNALIHRNPDIIAKIADEIADLSGIKDKELLRHKVLSQFTTYLSENKNRERKRRKRRKKIINESKEDFDFVMAPSKANHEVTIEKKAETAKMDKAIKLLNELLSELIEEVYEYGDEIHYDELKETEY